MNEKHNHVTRDIKPLGQCPACDDYHDKHIPKKSSLERIRDELKILFKEFDGNQKDEFIQKHLKIWNDAYDIMEDSRYHRVMINSVLAGFDKGAEEMAKIKDAQIEKLVAACNELLNNYWIDDQNPHNDPTIERVYLHQLRKALENFRKEVK